MRNRCPTHPGAILREDVLPQLTGMSVSAFARNLGISRQTLHAVLAERSGVEIVIADLIRNPCHLNLSGVKKLFTLRP